jgi:hypothetical protein
MRRNPINPVTQGCSAFEVHFGRLEINLEERRKVELLQGRTALDSGIDAQDVVLIVRDEEMFTQRHHRGGVAHAPANGQRRLRARPHGAE